MTNHKLAIKLLAVLLALSLFLPALPAQAVVVTTDNSYRFYMVGNSHIDTAWRWPIQHTAEEIIRDTFGLQVTCLKGNAGYKFTSSCSIHYKWTKEYYPEMYEDILDLFHKDQWGIAGGQFVEPDLNVMEGETFARQGLYAQHFFLEEFGRIAYANLVPDVFGFSGQFPQFIRKTGMTSYVATKMNWNDYPQDSNLDPGPYNQWSSGGGADSARESDLFWWEAIDGSDVLSYNCKKDYVSSYTTSEIRGSDANSVFNRLTRTGNFTLGATVSLNSGGTNTAVNNPYQGTYYFDYDTNIKYALGMYGSGDHGGGPNAGSTGANHGFPAANTGTATNTNTRIISATLDDYFNAVRVPGVGTFDVAGANRTETLRQPPYNNNALDRVYRHAGENYFRNHRGTYTSWSRVKKDNRQLNNLSQSAEQAATLGFWTNSLENNSNEKIEASWERICINTMHDILPGSSGPIQYYQTFMHNELCRNLLTNVMNNSLAALAHRADTTVDAGVPVFVYNPLSWQRDGGTTTTVKLDKGYDYIKVFDGAAELPATVIENGPDGVAKISFIAKAVPSLGYKVFKVVGSDTPSEVASTVSVTEAPGEFVVENENLRFTISKTTGNMPSLINKKDNNRETFYQGAAFQGNALQHKQDTGSGDGGFPAWDLVNSQFGGVNQAWTTVNTVAETPTVVVNTPEKVTIKVVQRITGGAYSSGNLQCSGNSLAVRYITLSAGSDKVDVHFDLDWQYRQQNLKVAFPVNVDARGASYEIAYGAMDGATEVKRIDTLPPTDTTAATPLMSNSITGTMPWAGALGRNTIRDTRWNIARFEHSGHKWMDVTADDKSSGMSILNDAKYGFDVLRMVRAGSVAIGMGTDAGITGNETYVRTRMTVVRSPDSAANSYQRNNQVPNPTNQIVDIGEQNFNYSIYPHAGTWQQAKTPEKGHEFNFVMQSFQAVPGAGDGILGKEKSFFSLNKNNAIIGAVKNQHDEQSNRNKLIVRVWETNGVDTSGVVLTLPSNVVSVREVNMLEHDYGDLSDDSIDAPISTKLVAQNIAHSGNTVTFDLGHYEILTMEIVIAPYAGTQFELKQAKVDLSAAFNLRGTSPDSDRRAGNLDNIGNTIPEPLWAEARIAGVDYQGIKFQLGPDAANNFVTATGQTIPLSGTGYSRVYLLGVGGRNGARGGVFTVNYADGSSVDKIVMFADWKSPLTGWVPMQRMDTVPYVYDSIAQVFTHWHDPVQDMMTFDNYLYVYYIEIDAAKTLASITLPDAVAAKLAAISLVNSEITGFGSTDEGKNAPADPSFYWDFSNLNTGTTGTNIDKAHIFGGEEATGHVPFTALTSFGISGYSSGEAPANILRNDGSTKVCGNITSTTNTFVLDAGAPVNFPYYVIRGANDDANYGPRRLNTWIITGSNSSTGPWTNVVSSPGSSPGWATNYESRIFPLSNIPESGYRYYRLEITRTGTGTGTALGTGNTMIQFSYIGFVSSVTQNGSLASQVVSNAPTTAGGVFTLNSVNGSRIVNLSGRIATDVTAPVAAKSYTQLRSDLNVGVYPDTKLSYIFKPSNAASTSMSLDIKFMDGGNLKDIARAVDINGVGANPAAQGAGGKLVVGEWNYVEIELGKFAAGRIVSEVVIGFETNTGEPGADLLGSFDNVAIFRDDYIDVNVHAALYSAKGTMLSYSMSAPLKATPFGSVLLPAPIVFDTSAAGTGAYVKAFVWTKDDFVPVIAAQRYAS